VLTLLSATMTPEDERQRRRARHPASIAAIVLRTLAIGAGRADAARPSPPRGAVRCFRHGVRAVAIDAAAAFKLAPPGGSATQRYALIAIQLAFAALFMQWRCCAGPSSHW
jgi:hypothetical protein